MPTYLYCNLGITSTIPLPELSIDKQIKSRIIFQVDNSQRKSEGFPWSYNWTSPNGDVLLSYYRQGETHWLHFPSLADFQISWNLVDIICYPLADISYKTIRHLLLDQVLPRCLAHQGRIMVHASAARLEKGVVFFIGDSGTGKSTLAGNFRQVGHTVISDDCLWIHRSRNKISAVSTYGGLRLWGDSLEALFPAQQKPGSETDVSIKQRVSFDKNEIHLLKKSLPVRGMIVLSPEEKSSKFEIYLDQLTKRESFLSLMKQSFQLDGMDLGRLKQQINSLSEIARLLPAYRLSFPHSFDLLPLVRQKILDTIR